MSSTSIHDSKLSPSLVQLQPESLPYAIRMEPSICIQEPPPQTYPSNNIQGTPQQPQVVFVTQQPSSGAGLAFGPTSNKMTCPSCQASIGTRVKHSSTSKTHLWACCLCFCCCWCCVCLPYCMSSCQNADHYCPQCHAYLGTYYT